MREFDVVPEWNGTSEAAHTVSAAQRERLLHIEFGLWFLGEVRRADLMARLGTSPAVTTRDLTLYQKLAPGNIAFDNSRKIYVLGSDFVPLFRHGGHRALTALSQGYGERVGEVSGSFVPAELPLHLSLPAVPIVAAVSRAIALHRPLRLVYHSFTSGRTERVICPFAIADTGARWHARAFDRRRGDFRDFVLTRMEHAEVLLSERRAVSEGPEYDMEWSRVIELTLVPHPAVARPEVVCMDFQMPDGGLKIRVRAAVAGYFLRIWNVDCSPDASMRGEEFRLWLADPLLLYGVQNAGLAPGYRAP